MHHHTRCCDFAWELSGEMLSGVSFLRKYAWCSTWQGLYEAARGMCDIEIRHHVTACIYMLNGSISSHVSAYQLNELGLSFDSQR